MKLQDLIGFKNIVYSYDVCSIEYAVDEQILKQELYFCPVPYEDP